MKIVTFACDRYATVAPAFHYLWQKHWPDCPHDMIYVANRQPLNVFAPIHYIRGAEPAFGWRLRQFIEKHYDDEHILLMMVDYLVKSLDAPLIAQAHQLCAMPGIRHVRLRPMPHPQSAHPAPGFGRITKGTRYSLSLQPGIWETQTIYDLCRDNEDPWQTEIQGSIRTRRLSGDFLSTETHAIAHLNYYRKGRADVAGLKRLEVPEVAWPREAKK